MRTAKLGARPKGDRLARIVKTDAEWRAGLDPEAYRVLREGGAPSGRSPASTTMFSSRARTGAPGAALELFSSEAKYDSGCGWPAFYAPGKRRRDRRGDRRELRNDSHRGHVRRDATATSGTCSRTARTRRGVRYCIKFRGSEAGGPPTAELENKKPSLCCMDRQSLRRRNTAVVQDTRAGRSATLLETASTAVLRPGCSPCKDRPS